ncbi:dihydrofolate reductase [Ktedonosporobacter rubrisoli]|uniref:Dihydrofolate reductase n=1 Tax=Ktedonosporobacter rubrisoli TaxID=2509675 RepID=A0A4P6JN30_KTERU|nr:dihydrofolate reductase family protein [Ktedonosporobacter rubrisoli]QBD76689.1 dihydrofolate reductase [Ktedonosporobacter rubrisoli]
MKIRAAEIVTLDGVMEACNQWIFPYLDQEIEVDVINTLLETDAFLFGRKTYLELTTWANRNSAMAELFNILPKYVVSGTLKEVTWNNSHIISGNIVEEVAKLKAQPGEYLLINGSADLVRLLAQHDLIDEYYLSIVPLVLGKGKRLFPEGDQAKLQLLDCKAYKTGLLHLSYGPIKQ